MLTSPLAGAVVVAALLPATAVSAAAPSWRVPPLPPAAETGYNSILQDVSVQAPDDVWTVGAQWDADETEPWAVHWDGTAWSVASLPKLAQQSYLTGVDGLAPDDVWAVGSGDNDAPGAPTPTSAVILHFDGTAWAAVPVPAAPDGVESDLDDLDMRTPDDGWAVGHTVGSGETEPFILHWQGGQWAVATAIKVPGAALTSVAAVAADDVWAVGTVTGALGKRSGLVLHYDGVSWSQVTVPAVGAAVALNSVAVAGGEVWIGGFSCLGTRVICRPLVLHRVGGDWRTEEGAGGTAVVEVVATKSDVWTFGYTATTAGTTGHIEHWNGLKFLTDNTIQVPGSSSGPAIPHGEIGSLIPLAGAAGDPATGVVWAVGWTSGPPRQPNVIVWQ